MKITTNTMAPPMMMPASLARLSLAFFAQLVRSTLTMIASELTSI